LRYNPRNTGRLLQDQLNLITEGTLHGPAVRTIPFTDVVAAHRGLTTLEPGHKLVLDMSPKA